MPNPSPTPPRSTLQFVEQALSTHNNVETFRQRANGLYEIERKKGSEVVVSFTDLYTLGTADVIEAMHTSSDLICVVTTSEWNSYYKGREAVRKRTRGRRFQTSRIPRRSLGRQALELC